MSPQTRYRPGHAVVRADAGKSGPIRFVAASEGKQADGIDLRMAGCSLVRYSANPVVGFGHAYFGRDNLPIGRSVNSFTEGRHLYADVEFDQGDPFAVEVERKIRARVLNAVSIGFEVTEWEGGKGDYRSGGVATGWAVTEISVVPVPMDAEAVVASGRSMRAFTDLMTGLGTAPAPGSTVDPAAARRLLGAFDEFHEQQLRERVRRTVSDVVADFVRAR